MNKIKALCILIVSILIINSAAAQQVSIETASDLVKQEQLTFSQMLTSSQIDTNLIIRLRKFITIEADSIKRALVKNRRLSKTEKIQGIRSIEFVLKGLRERVSVAKLEVYDIPGMLDSYKDMLRSLLYKGDYMNVLKPLGEQRSRLLANTFWQCKECYLLDDVTTFKRLATAPDFILMNLEKQPVHYFQDSLLYIAAAYDPAKMANFINRSKSPLVDAIRNSSNIYLKKIVELSDIRDAQDVLPFTKQIVEGSLTVDSIRKARADVSAYYKLLVNALQQTLPADGTTGNGFENALQNAIREKSLYFYVRTINELHDEQDKERFASVNNLRPQDLYYIITSTGNELYTSTYLGLFKRIMNGLQKSSTDSLFALVKYNEFHKFLRLSSNYNVLPEFLNGMSDEEARKNLRKYIGGIGDNTANGLERAMDVADLYTGLMSSEKISSWVLNELQTNYNKSRDNHEYFGLRLYDILLQLYDLVKSNDPNHNLWKTLGNHEILNYSKLVNANSEVIQQVMFFGDKDGIASFKSFLSLFTDAGKWEVEKNDQWVKIRSKGTNRVTLYANVPLDNEKKLDVEAQHALAKYLTEQDIHPSILIHRGHSYHLAHTFERLQPSIKLVLLGSCGGYNNNLSIANFSPDAQIIVSKKVGSMAINDPMIDIINKSLLDGRDLVWNSIWSETASRIQKNPVAADLFNEYLPPSKNVNIFVLKMFNQKDVARK